MVTCFRLASGPYKSRLSSVTIAPKSSTECMSHILSAANNEPAARSVARTLVFSFSERCCSCFQHRFHLLLEPSHPCFQVGVLLLQNIILASELQHFHAGGSPKELRSPIHDVVGPFARLVETHN